MNFDVARIFFFLYISVDPFLFIRSFYGARLQNRNQSRGVLDFGSKHYNVALS